MAFDEMAGIQGEFTLTRRPLLTLGESEPTANGQAKQGSYQAAERVHGNANQAYRDKAEKPDVGADWMKGRGTTAAARTQKPWQSDTE